MSSFWNREPKPLANDHHAKPGDPRYSNLRKCPACGKPFYINDGHRQYGSDACKQAAYRARKLQTRNARREAAALARNAPRAALRAIARNKEED